MKDKKVDERDTAAPRVRLIFRFRFKLGRGFCGIEQALDRHTCSRGNEQKPCDVREKIRRVRNVVNVHESVV